MIPLTPSIEVTEVTKTFGGRSARGRAAAVRAVDNLSLRIDPGEVVAFLGPNGAGKTTAIDMMLGLTTPDSGSIQVCGTDPRRAVLSGKVSAVLQTGGLLRDLTVRETVRIIASTFSEHRPVDDVIDQADLGQIAHRKVSKCSGGEQQRLRFALALLPDPRVLILDEPTTGMDAGVRKSFWETMRTDADAGRTVLFATHYLHEAETFAQRIVMIADGRIVADGSMDQIREQYADRTLSVDLPDRDVEPWLAQIRAVPGIREVTVASSRVWIRAEDSDAAALALLRDHQVRNLEITGADLEAAFFALTGTALGDDDAATTPRHHDATGQEA